MKSHLISLPAVMAKLCFGSVVAATLAVSATAAKASSDVQAVVYDCHFTQWTNGINPITQTAVLQLTPGAEPEANLFFGDYKAMVDMYWLTDGSNAVGINLSLWHDAADKQETSTHTDSLDPKVSLHMQNSGPQFFDFDCIKAGAAGT